MIPKEIVERVRRSNEEGRAYCAATHHSESTTLQQCSDISHLLAIHAAVVEMFEAYKAYEASMQDVVNFEVLDEFIAAKAKLADLCGWKAEERA